MTKDRLAAVRKCAEWVGWKEVRPPYVRQPGGRGYDWLDRIPDRHDTHCVLWEACRTKLEDRERAAKRPFNQFDVSDQVALWWHHHGVRRCKSYGPLENLEALAEVLR